MLKNLMAMRDDQHKQRVGIYSDTLTRAMAPDIVIHSRTDL